MDLNLSGCVLLDFGGMNYHLKDKTLLYMDLSERSDYAEAINRVYDYLRISETQENGDMVLISNMLSNSESDSDDEISHSEHRSALFDRLFRAVTGQAIKFNESLTKYSISQL